MAETGRLNAGEGREGAGWVRLHPVTALRIFIIATVLLAWVILFDYPVDSGPAIGAFVALVSAIAVMGGAGDYSTLRGAPAFPRIERSG